MLIGICSLHAQEQETTYLPVFGEDTTSYHIGGQYATGSPAEVFRANYIKNKTENGVYNLVESYQGFPEQLRISADNSKMWIKYSGGEALIMDLSLNVGDTYKSEYRQTYTVSKVYEKNGRKHVEFDVPMHVSFGWGEDHADEGMRPLVFIEGIGPNVFFLTGSNSWVLSQFKDGELSYGLPEWEGRWDFIGEVPTAPAEEPPFEENAVFAPIGAKWHYGITPTLFGPDRHYRTFEATHDTIIEGQQCRVVQVVEHLSASESHKRKSEYFYTKGQKVYNWLHEEGRFNLLYDFSAKVGDYWEVDIWQDKIRLFVEAVDEIDISGIKLKKLTLSWRDNSILPPSFGTCIIERIGGDYNMFLYNYSESHMDVPYLRCYADHEISYRAQNAPANCEEIRTGIEDISLKPDFFISMDREFISWNKNCGLLARKAYFYDSLGRVVRYCEFADDKISISELPAGQYILKVITIPFAEKTFKINKP